MQRIQLPGSRLWVSRFSFGTASLHHVGGADAQADHLRAAAASGFSHFDTAPLYGFAGAERAFGVAFGGSRRPDISVATKVGLYPPGGTSQPRVAVLARKALGRVVPSLSRPRADWATSVARQSLEQSLRRLRRDHVDLLFLHEPDIDLVQTDTWLRWLEDEVSAGRVGAFGLSGTRKFVEAFVAEGNPIANILQTQDSVSGREADFLIAYKQRPQITYGYLSGANAKHKIEDVLHDALARNCSDSILVSTRSRQRLPIFAAAVDAADPNQDEA